MAASILAYSLFAAAASFAPSTEILCALWFLACTGVGGMWPNGVALVSEAWSGMSRPAVAGLIGTAANIGIFLFSSLAREVAIRPDQWRWAFQLGACPVVLGILAWLVVPESPRWLASRDERREVKHEESSVFRPPLLGVTLIAIILATVPMIGGWGTANWMNPWAELAGGANLKASVLQWRSLTGLVGSLLGGWIAAYLGRRLVYFLVSLLSLGLAQYIFVFLVPTDATFLLWVSVLGFVSGVYFGWLPLCLPEMFPTHVRSTGAGVGFNFGRIVTAITIFATGALTHLFDGDYARIGRVTSLLFVLGMVAILLMPRTARQLD
jgi:MFS family permease